MAAMAAACLTANAQPKPIYQDASQPIEQRVEDALARMTVEEKIQLIHANGGYCSGGVPRLGIPGNFPTDGPVGLRPVKELKRFCKIKLAPGESQCLTFDISKEDLSYYDVSIHGWKAEPGKFQILVGSASDDIRSTATFVWEE